ncbi:PREDICTED: allergen Fel d 4-like [Chrysochloris asiatica]|uniref:Allergen Fel d 4-like n=1 Tax=Chrysochloris asiatica TaxID=185453 RepID=A0A9B0TIL7_CHRAS|nr:PREDICTED: allergen Fel d 4-like [Chrysochloris asiatica]
MKLLLLCLGLSLACAHVEGKPNVVKHNINMTKAAGVWYSVLLASDDREQIEENGSMRVFVQSMEVLDNFSLYFEFHTIKDGKCTDINFVCDKTEENGVYSVKYDGYNTFKAVETNYDEYIMFHLQNVNDEHNFQLMELYGRDKDLSQDIKDRFVRYCRQHGVPEENILDLTTVDRCLEARDEKETQGEEEA